LVCSANKYIIAIRILWMPIAMCIVCC
jgi:hypothetical protein